MVPFPRRAVIVLGGPPCHDLRHTAATLMLTAGANPKVVSEMLGHFSVAITLDRYSHVMPTIRPTRCAGSTAC